MAFRDDWRDNPVLRGSPWNFLYDASGMVRPPGYPLFIAGVEEVLGTSDSALQDALAVVDGGSAVVIARIAGVLFGGLPGRVAGLLFGLHPISIQCVNLRAREPLIVLLTALGVYLLLKSLSGKEVRRATLAGVFFGLGALVKETVLIVGLVAAVWLAAVGPRSKKRIVAVGLLMLATILPASVWVMRNSLHHGRFTGMSTLGGLNLWYGLVQQEPLRGLYRSKAVADVAEQVPRHPTSGADVDQRLVRLVRKHVIEHPADAFGRVLRNIGLFWSPISRSILAKGFQTRPVEIISLLYFALVLSLFVVALYSERSRPESVLVIAVVLIMTASHAVFDAAPRFRMTIELFVVTFAAQSLTQLLFMLAQRGRLGARGSN